VIAFCDGPRRIDATYASTRHETLRGDRTGSRCRIGLPVHSGKNDRQPNGMIQDIWNVVNDLRSIAKKK
jgi:hypothetical protein